jgi:hypothetical protein
VYCGKLKNTTKPIFNYYLNMNSNDMINQIKTLLGMETKLAQAKLENGTIIETEEMTQGNEIFIVTEEERIAMPVGEYQLEDGQVLIVEEEGIIASVGAKEEAPEEEVEAEVAEDLSEEVNEELSEEVSEEVTEENLEEEKEEMGYATKEELAEVKSMIEEIKAMIEKKEEMSEEVQEVKEELSAVEKVTHNPETEDKKISFLYGQSRPQNTMDRVMAKISQIKK